MEQLEKYKKQFVEFCKIDDFNLESRAKHVPAEKHYWVAALIDAKIERDKLLKNKKKIKASLTEKIINEGIVTLNKKTLDSIDNSDKIVDIDEKIQEISLLIEYLEMIVKIITFIGNDIKNIIEIKQLEQL